LMGYCGAVAAALALAKTQVARQHIAVEVLIRIFPRTLQSILSIIGSLIGVIFFVLAALQTWLMGNNFWQVNELSETLRLAYFPFVYAVSLGLAVIALVLAIQMLQELKGNKKL
jgi:TRAP-type C4-dicarboxylate transport system permease small subunit